MEATLAKKPVIKRKAILAIPVLCTCAALAVTGLTAARYITSSHENAPAVAAELYFISDKLTVAGTSHTVVWWDQDTPLELDLQIKNAKDSLNITKESVTYTLSAECDDYAVTADYPEEVQTLTPEGGEALASVLTNKHTVTLKKTDDLPDFFTVTVKATATEPYETEIWADYTVLIPMGMVQSMVTDAEGRLAAEWTIAVGTEYDVGDDLPVEIGWPAGVTPDRSNPIFKDVEPGESSASVLLPTGGVHRILFYKTDPSVDYSTSAGFKLTLN